MTVFQFDLDKLRNYLWYSYEKQWCLLEVGFKRTPKCFDLLKIWETSPKIRVKMAPNLAWLQKRRPSFAENHMKTFFGGHTTKGLHDLRGREFVGKSCTKNFSWKFGEIRAKILRHTKIFPAVKPMMKRHLRPVAPLLKGQRDECLRHASIFRRPCAFTRCRLQFATVMNINYQRYPQTEPFITAKISGNALKQGE